MAAGRRWCGSPSPSGPALMASQQVGVGRALRVTRQPPPPPSHALLGHEGTLPALSDPEPAPCLLGSALSICVSCLDSLGLGFGKARRRVG